MNTYSKICWRVNRILSKLRVAHFRLKGVQIGENVFIDRGVQITGDVEIGAGSNIGSYTYIGTVNNGKVIIGPDCHIGKLSQLGSGGSMVRIGAHCIFAPYVQITDATHGFKPASIRIKSAPITASPINIGENVWLGSAAMVSMGVDIGEGAVVGAKALVRENVPANAIVVGVPSRVVGYRDQ